MEIERQRLVSELPSDTITAVASGRIGQTSQMISGVTLGSDEANRNFELRGVKSELGETKSPLALAEFASVTSAQKRKLQNDGSTAHDGMSATRAAHLSVLQTADEASLNEGQTTTMFEPELDIRGFNEIDIVGDLDRDDRGNVLLFLDEATGKSVLIDAQYRPVNTYGYLVDKATGDIIDGYGRKVFDRRDLDERGNLPMPYALEKFNFNPFDL